jgi:hypothetical protein
MGQTASMSFRALPLIIKSLLAVLYDLTFKNMVPPFDAAADSWVWKPARMTFTLPSRSNGSEEAGLVI